MFVDVQGCDVFDLINHEECFVILVFLSSACKRTLPQQNFVLQLLPLHLSNEQMRKKRVCSDTVLQSNWIIENV